MNKIFYNCSFLNSLNLSNFNTNNVINMDNIFDGINKHCNLICNDYKVKKKFKAICSIF